VYPEATPVVHKRPEPSSSTKQERDGGSDRKRVKRFDDMGLLDNRKSIEYAEDILAFQYLTEKIWDELLDYYKIHFATELPFLHLPTLKEKLAMRLQDPTYATTADTNLVLLGILTLTAPFHTDITKYIAHMLVPQNKQRSIYTKMGTDPPTAAEFFATALSTALGPLRTAMTVPTLERVQAYLMLGLHEWSLGKPGCGLGAWMYVGMAIRMAQAMKLGFGDKSPPDENWSRDVKDTSSELIIDRESRRRTMFSCLVLDRMLACGKERACVIRSEDLQIQLPCTEMAFDLANPVYTGFLHPTAEEIQRPINDDSVLSRFIQLVPLWGEISKYSFAGGRTLDGQHPPWENGTEFRRLREKLDSFRARLPDSFKNKRQNYFRHSNHQAASTFVSLHMLYSLCKVMLHREYIPFIPLNCSKPVGPLDPPMFSQHSAPHGFWEDSAQEVFKAAYRIIELIEMCGQKLPHSSLGLFAVWTCAYVGLYAQHFPHMDTERWMVTGEEADARKAGENVEVATTMRAGLAFRILKRMKRCLHGAAPYVAKFQDQDRYFTCIVKEHQNQKTKPRPFGIDIPDGTKPNFRHGGAGGGLDEWRLQSASITSNGNILDANDRDNYGASDVSRASTLERRSTSVGPEGYVSGHRRTSHSTPSGIFAAINNPPSALPSAHERQNGSSVIPPGAGTSPQVPTRLFTESGVHILDPLGILGGEFGFGTYDMEKYITDAQGYRLGFLLNDIEAFSRGSPAEGYMPIFPVEENPVSTLTAETEPALLDTFMED
jgi:hypothetical protein